MAKIRCINIDWLEVYCLEPFSLDAQYFERQGYKVRQRCYGTPMYEQMFTLYYGKEPLIEVRRAPYSRKSQAGIFEDNSVHLRLPNIQCYKHHPVEFLQAFIKRHRYQYVSTTRIDFCLDFNTFDYNRDVPNFIRKYMAGRYFKMNQSRLDAHGVDCWPLREFWSLKWGSQQSALTTKLYDKTLELSQAGHDKPYIWDAWRDAGLDVQRQVYRVEYSIKGAELKRLRKEQIERVEMVDTSTGEIHWNREKFDNLIALDFNNYPTRDACLFTFMALSDKYFDFREATNTSQGKPQRRDRCPRVYLFATSADQQGYKPLRFVTKPQPSRTLLMLAKKLISMAQDPEHYTEKLRNSCREIAAQLIRESRMKEHGVDLPIVQETLKLIQERAPMSDRQFKEFLERYVSKVDNGFYHPQQKINLPF